MTALSLCDYCAKWPLGQNYLLHYVILTSDHSVGRSSKVWEARSGRPGPLNFEQIRASAGLKSRDILGTVKVRLQDAGFLVSHGKFSHMNGRQLGVAGLGYDPCRSVELVRTRCG